MEQPLQNNVNTFIRIFDTGCKIIEPRSISSFSFNLSWASLELLEPLKYPLFWDAMNATGKSDNCTCNNLKTYVHFISIANMYFFVASQTRFRDTTFVLILSISSSVMTTLYLPDSQLHIVTDSGCVPLRPDNGIFTIVFQIADKDSLVQRNLDEILYEFHCFSERNASYRSWGSCMCVVYSA